MIRLYNLIQKWKNYIKGMLISIYIQVKLLKKYKNMKMLYWFMTKNYNYSEIHIIILKNIKVKQKSV